jgi:hypothetical protein
LSDRLRRPARYANQLPQQVERFELRNPAAGVMLDNAALKDLWQKVVTPLPSERLSLICVLRSI